MERSSSRRRKAAEADRELTLSKRYEKARTSERAGLFGMRAGACGSEHKFWVLREPIQEIGLGAEPEELEDLGGDDGTRPAEATDGVAEVVSGCGRVHGAAEQHESVVPLDTGRSRLEASGAQLLGEALGLEAVTITNLLKVREGHVADPYGCHRIPISQGAGIYYYSIKTIKCK